MIEYPESFFATNLKSQNEKSILIFVKGLLLNIFIFTFFLVSFTSSSQQTINVGLVDTNGMEILYNLKWFSNKYVDFTPTYKLTDKIVKDLEHSHFFVFMGTWCHDTKMFLPKFFKLLDSLNISKDQITLFNVDEKKRHPKAPIKKFGIQYLPTVVFIKDDIEIGRIVEFPFSSMEEDISKIYENLKKDTKE